jgi:hypothetical protein
LLLPADTTYYQLASTARDMRDMVAENSRLAALMLHQQEQTINDLQEQVWEGKGAAPWCGAVP